MKASIKGVVGDPHSTGVRSGKVKWMREHQQRALIRWLHIILSIPIVGFIYGPVSGIENAAFMVRWVFFPVIVISGLWLWKGFAVKKWYSKWVSHLFPADLADPEL